MSAAPDQSPAAKTRGRPIGTSTGPTPFLYKVIGDRIGECELGKAKGWRQTQWCKLTYAHRSNREMSLYGCRRHHECDYRVVQYKRRDANGIHNGYEFYTKPGADVHTESNRRHKKRYVDCAPACPEYLDRSLCAKIDMMLQERMQFKEIHLQLEREARGAWAPSREACDLIGAEGALRAEVKKRSKVLRELYKDDPSSTLVKRGRAAESDDEAAPPRQNTCVECCKRAPTWDVRCTACRAPDWAYGARVAMEAASGGFFAPMGQVQ
jgi:hypothetical protein